MTNIDIKSIAIATALVVGGAVIPQGAIAAASATARLVDAEMQTVGSAELLQTPHGVLIMADLESLPPGVHGFHIHETGACEPPFESAGSHFDPGGHAHGIFSTDGMHAGDLPNIHVPASRGLTVQVLAPRVTLAEGESHSLLDGDGAALVVHQGADDYESDPSGDAGRRIACGVIEPGA